MSRPPRPHRQRADLTLDRLLILARHLIGEWRTLLELGAHLGCTVRTIQRGLVTLRRAGLEVERRRIGAGEAEFRVEAREARRWAMGERDA